MGDEQAAKAAGEGGVQGSGGAVPGEHKGGLEEARGARLVRRTPRTARALDPHGIYDARSMARRQHARRRRTLSSLLLLGAVAIAGSAFILRGHEPRVPAWAPARTLLLSQDVAALASLPASVAPDAAASGDTQQSPQVVIAARDGRLAVVDALGMEQSWDASDFPLRAPPLIVRGMAVVGGEDGDLAAFDLASRRLKWRSHGQSAISSRAVFFAAASAAPGPASGAPAPAPAPPALPAAPALAAGAPSNTSAAPSTGSTGAAPTGPPSTSPAEDAVAVGDDSGVVRALRLRDGQPLWSARLGAPCGGGLSVSRVGGGRTLIFVPLLSGGARRGGVAALDARDGRLAWRYPGDERVFAAVSTTPLARAVDGQMRLFCADEAGAVSALDAATGSATGGATARSAPASAPASASSRGVVWKTFLAPIFQAAQPASGGSSDARPFWQRWLSAGGSAVGRGGTGVPGEPMLVSVRAEPLWIVAARGPLLLVAGNDGGVRALEARSGRLAWVVEAGEAPIALLNAPAGRLGSSVVVVTPHAVERLSAEDGRRLSRFEWGDGAGRAQAAASTRSHLFVAGRQLQIFSWAAAP